MRLINGGAKAGGVLARACALRVFLSICLNIPNHSPPENGAVLSCFRVLQERFAMANCFCDCNENSYSRCLFFFTFSTAVLALFTSNCYPLEAPARQSWSLGSPLFKHIYQRAGLPYQQNRWTGGRRGLSIVSIWYIRVIGCASWPNRGV